LSLSVCLPVCLSSLFTSRSILKIARKHRTSKPHTHTHIHAYTQVLPHTHSLSLTNLLPILTVPNRYAVEKNTAALLTRLTRLDEARTHYLNALKIDPSGRKIKFPLCVCVCVCVCVRAFFLIILDSVERYFSSEPGNPYAVKPSFPALKSVHRKDIYWVIIVADSAGNVNRRQLTASSPVEVWAVQMGVKKRKSRKMVGMKRKSGGRFQRLLDAGKHTHTHTHTHSSNVPHPFFFFLVDLLVWYHLGKVCTQLHDFVLARYCFEKV
jgi:hypothetical protein